MELQLDGVRFDALDEGDGPAIVLIHGFPLAKETWDAQAAALSRSARVVRFDLRGLGASSVPPGPYLMETLASDVAAILDALEIERAVIVGHSLGGYVAFAFFRMFAERCLGLGFVCTRASADDPATSSARFELATRAETEGIGAVKRAMVPRYFAPAVYAQRPELVERADRIVDRSDPRGAAATLRGMAARVSSEDLLSEIAVPVRVVAGEQDALIPLESARAIALGIRHAELDVFPCGHFPLSEMPEELNRSLDALLQRAR